jgi:hypothetical protein
MAAAPATFVVVVLVTVALCGGVGRAQDMDNEWARYRGFFGGGGTLLPQSDVDLLEFPLNLEYLETEFFCWSALGYGLDGIDVNLTGGGPAPIGGQTAALTPFVRDVATQFCYQEVGHLKYVYAIDQLTSQFARPDLSNYQHTSTSL